MLLGKFEILFKWFLFCRGFGKKLILGRFARFEEYCLCVFKVYGDFYEGFLLNIRNKCMFDK